jgi:hypothetical protein
VGKRKRKFKSAGGAAQVGPCLAFYHAQPRIGTQRSAGFALVGVEEADTRVPHHGKRSFEQEFITLLKKHGIAFDPKHVFD